MRREQNTTMVFPVLGSLYCDETVNQSVAALIDGVWECVDILDPAIQPNHTKRGMLLRDAGRVNPPSTCAWDEAPLLFNVSIQSWECVNPDRALIQYVRNAPRPVCNDTDLVVYNENENWFQCKALDLIAFKSTITPSDLRWQVPSTTRHIGSLASTGHVQSGQYYNFRWSQYAFSASTDQIAYDQTSPPQIITTGGVSWAAYTISTTFVGLSGSSPYYKQQFSPIYPGTQGSYNNNITKTAPGTVITGNSYTFAPCVLSFPVSGDTVSVSYVGSSFHYYAANGGPAGGLLIVPLSNVTVAVDLYPAIEISFDVSNWYVGTTPEFNQNLILTLAMWLQYSAPSGF